MPASATPNDSPLSSWALDREIVLSRVIDAPRDLVFSAWADPRHLPRWFGPAGFTVETKSIDLRAGGEWRFDMIAPDCKRDTNRMRFRRIESPRLTRLSIAVWQALDGDLQLDEARTARASATTPASRAGASAARSRRC